MPELRMHSTVSEFMKDGEPTGELDLADLGRVLNRLFDVLAGFPPQHAGVGPVPCRKGGRPLHGQRKGQHVPLELCQTVSLEGSQHGPRQVAFLRLENASPQFGQRILDEDLGIRVLRVIEAVVGSIGLDRVKGLAAREDGVPLEGFQVEAASPLWPGDPDRCEVDSDSPPRKSTDRPLPPIGQADGPENLGHREKPFAVPQQAITDVLSAALLQAPVGLAGS